MKTKGEWREEQTKRAAGLRFGPAGETFERMVAAYGSVVVFYILDGDDRFQRAVTAAIEDHQRHGHGEVNQSFAYKMRQHRRLHGGQLQRGNESLFFARAVLARADAALISLVDAFGADVVMDELEFLAYRDDAYFPADPTDERPAPFNIDDWT